MKPRPSPLLVLVYAAALGLSNAFAHSTPIDLQITTGNTLEIAAFALENIPVPKMQMILLLDQNRQNKARVELIETGNGVYSAKLPKVKPGTYRLEMIDQTAGFVPVQASVSTTWPPVKRLLVRLPASTSPPPDTGSELLLMGLPVLLAVIVLIVVLRTRKPSTEEEGVPQNPS